MTHRSLRLPMTCAGVLLLSIGFLPCRLLGQTPQLLADVRPTLRPADSSPYDFVAAGSNVFFTARTSAYGRELWRCDGTATGTVRLTDLSPGPSEVRIAHLTKVGTDVVFVVGDPAGPQDLWASDGTVAGTRRVQAFGGSVWIIPGEAGGSVLLMTRDALWRTDGTTSGTVRIDAFQGALGIVGPAATLGSSWFFRSGSEIWRTDGTASGTQRIDAAARPFVDPVVVGDAICYAGATGGVNFVDATSRRFVVPTSSPVTEVATVPGRVVYVSAGVVHAFEVADLQPRQLTGTTDRAVQLIVSGSRIYFLLRDATHGQELWVSDGTSIGTHLVHDAEPGPNSPQHDLLLPYAGGLLHSFTRLSGTTLVWVADTVPPRFLRAFGAPIVSAATSGGLAWFAADDGVAGRELWVSDGGAGTRLFADLETGLVSEGSYPAFFVAAADAMYFSAYDDVHGRELFVTDGTSAGTRLVVDLWPGRTSSDPVLLGWHAGVLYFVAQTAAAGYQIWGSDGTAAGTRPLVSSPSTLLFLARMRPLDATRVLLNVDDPVASASVWVSDGRTASYLTDVRPISDQVRVGSRAYIAGLVAPGKYDLMVSDGSLAGTRLVVSLNGSQDAVVAPVAALGERVLFTALIGTTHQLFVSDGTASGTQALLPMAPIEKALTVGARTYLIEAAGPSALWVTDGTTQGTRRLADLEGGTANLTAVDGRVLIGTTRGVWTTDGTSAGTVRLRDRQLLGASAVSDGRFAYWLSLTPSGILRSDGTTAGTTLLPTAAITPETIGQAAGRVYFGADDLLHGSEPFVLDTGSAAQELGVGCGARAVVPELTGSVPLLGGTSRLRLEGLPEAGVAALRLQLPAPAPVSIPGTACVTWGLWNGPSVQWTRPFAGGRLDELLPIPGTRDLLDAAVLIEGVVASTAGLELSNGLRWRIGR
ncbi:MAG: hypothetical protein R3F56_09270 [Planctomycetota bacterium]